MPAETPSPSPLNSEERAKFERVARILAANPADSALALLSKAREAWAELLEARQSHATEREAGEAAARDWIAWKHASESYRAGFSVRLEATGARVQAAWADLAKILGTGE